MKAQQTLTGTARARARNRSAILAPISHVWRIGQMLGLAAATSVLVSSAALASTPHEQFLKAVGKIAPMSPAKAKRLCMCSDASHLVGELRTVYAEQNGIVSYMLACEWTRFSPYDGSVDSTYRCTGGFEILPKR